MKVLLVAHGYPPELVGGTEGAVRSLAHGLARRGVDVVVVAGSIDHAGGFRTSEAADGPVRVRRIHRADLFFDHWQKSASARVAGAFRAMLREEQPDVVHVHHWIRLTHDLVALAAREGVPACVTLHDFWATCLVTFRVRPDTEAFCEAPLGPHPCLACAALVPPRTPWVPRDEQALRLAERRAALAGELALARAVLAPTRAHADAAASFLGLDAGALAVRVLPPGRDLSLARREPPPPPGPDAPLVLSSWGNRHPLKGTDLLLEALRRLPEPGRVRLELAGTDSSEAYAARCRELARGLDVRFHGPFAADELDRHPATAAHAMVGGTRARESWGLVLEEAAALGLPMVVPRTPAFAERLEEGRGALLYEQGDADALAACVRRLLDEPALLPALRAALPAARELCPDEDEVAERTLAIYAEARAAGPPAPPPEAWWAERIALAREEAWDAALAAARPEETGLG